MGDAGGEHARLAGAGPGQHQERAVQALHRVPLLGVQGVEILGGPPAHGALRQGPRVRGLIFVVGNWERCCVGANL